MGSAGTNPAIVALGAPAATLGLQPGAVALVESNPRWPQLFDAVAAEINQACDGLTHKVEHVGSTAVPGLDAKPVLDIAVGITATTTNETIVDRLRSAGFDFVQDLGMYGGLFLTAEAVTGVVCHIHVVAIDDFQWRRYLTFRDGLRRDGELRDRYAALKRNAAAKHGSDRDAYTSAKFEWVLAAVQELDDVS